MIFNATRLPVDAPAGVSDQIVSLGRTEDVKMSPGRDRLAVAEFEDNQISLFDIGTIGKDNGTR